MQGLSSYRGSLAFQGISPSSRTWCAFLCLATNVLLLGCWCHFSYLSAMLQNHL